MFWLGCCGHRVPSEEPKGIPGGPLRAQGAAQGRPRNLCHGSTYLPSVQKPLWGGEEGRINKYKQNVPRSNTPNGCLARRIFRRR